MSRPRSRSVLAARLAVLLVLSAGTVSCSASPPATVQPIARLSCGDGPSFTADELTGRADEPGSDDLGRTLAAFLTRPEAAGSGFPREGWVRVTSGASAALFIARATGPSAPYGFVAMTRQGGSWIPTSWGGCLPSRDDGTTRAASWRLLSIPARDAATIDAVVTLDRCSGPPAVVTPEVQLSAVTVAITMLTPVDTSTGVQGCVGEDRSVTVSLGEPLGGRIIVDGGTIPNRPVTLVTPQIDPGEAAPGRSVR